MSKVAIIGSCGVVGKVLVDHFEKLGHEVFPVDRDTELKLEDAIPLVDIVFIVTRPIKEAGFLINKVASLMNPDTLLIHGTSIANLADLEVEKILSMGITFSHLHFHFRPERPLCQTLFGTHITISIQGGKHEEWRRWIIDQFEPYKPFIHWLNPGEHDEITTVSQLVHMLAAVIVSGIWGNFQKPIVQKAVIIGGPPCRLLVRSVLRVGTGAKVTEDILYNHPSTIHIIGVIDDVLKTLRSNLMTERPDVLAAQLSKARGEMNQEQLKLLDNSTNKLIRLEADIQKENFEFKFQKEKNVIGLLARVLGEFDKRGVDKTTTIAQVDSDSGCTITIGVREMNENALEAAKVINEWILS
ncbi:MAG: hypothetical protein A3F47_01495 [Candidatus Staskawiczbacteria bacterium RIFCSPHIGHO2_12_FULL_38_11]|uniref:Uncharacterized protein n=1 Tax=Candidatus Staskawiczbacteria bacterium RIFCSPHIGHO2_12_FULL_38_11 TaxID=1802209 RepID=A0A1G2I7J8_9BACT|nr:MAG: hypothetical protein A3F47_01495 [Candidatus Staskawiczbacteria bacterium RIFCSPHIGHO2_12_FULL_38_11]